MLEYQLKTVPELEKVEIFITPKRELVFELTERKPLFKVKQIDCFIQILMVFYFLTKI